MSYGVDRRRSLDSELLRLCCKPAAAALIGPLAWELPYASGAALKKKKKSKQNKTHTHNVKSANTRALLRNQESVVLYNSKHAGRQYQGLL